MWTKVKRFANLFKNMGWRYVSFRIGHMLYSKLGIHKAKFPTNPQLKTFIRLNEWRNNTPIFFFESKETLKVTKKKNSLLAQQVENIKQGNITLFSSKTYNLGKAYNWLTNPATGFEYDISKHWSEIEDYSKKAGDIKYVWEKARFSYLYDIIRHDYHNDCDESQFVFSEIEHFIDANPINQGPNYKCSQEISLRTLNWIFALYYYKNSEHLTETLFNKIIHVIYWQMHHVYHNINFSRIAVRNNHAITETLMLYLSGLLFPFFPDTKKWSIKGKQWFEQEIEYQIYDDGTFLQFSMNYHRVVIQLLTWGIQLAELHKDILSNKIYDSAKKSLHFLQTCQDPVSKQLPNYGANDGALFFKLTDNDYRNYQSQLNDLQAVLYKTVTAHSESQEWYGLQQLKLEHQSKDGVFSFNKSGYYIMQEADVKTFVRCGAFKDRPSQADNLHLDIWANGINYLWDVGSYLYNTDEKTINYFIGTQGHNTLGVNNENQMLKGSRFIWYHWIKQAYGDINEDDESYTFKGNIKAFKNIGTRQHTRTIKKIKGQLKWHILDEILPLQQNDILTQYWNVNPRVANKVKIEAFSDNKSLPMNEENLWYSGCYGIKSSSIQYSFKTQNSEIKTTIEILN